MLTFVFDNRDMCRYYVFFSVLRHVETSNFSRFAVDFKASLRIHSHLPRSAADLGHELRLHEHAGLDTHIHGISTRAAARQKYEVSSLFTRFQSYILML